MINPSSTLHVFLKMLDVRQNKFQTAIEALDDCIQAYNSCFTDCLREPDVGALVGCIQLDQDCAGICTLTLYYLSRDSQFALSVAKQCALVCDACAIECEKHACIWNIAEFVPKFAGNAQLNVGLSVKAHEEKVRSIFRSTLEKR
jgi:hypothetical protein